MWFRFFNLIVLLTALAAVGCGGRDIPIVAINGTLTFGGSPPPKEGKIMFSPVKNGGTENPGSGLLARPGYAKFDADGSFTVTTYSPGDGLIPGTYRTKVLCFREPPTLTNQDAVSYVPRDFNPEVIVPRDGSSSLAINIDVPPTRLRETAQK